MDSGIEWYQNLNREHSHSKSTDIEQQWTWMKKQHWIVWILEKWNLMVYHNQIDYRVPLESDENGRTNWEWRFNDYLIWDNIMNNNKEVTIFLKMAWLIEINSELSIPICSYCDEYFIVLLLHHYHLININQFDVFLSYIKW